MGEGVCDESRAAILAFFGSFIFALCNNIIIGIDEITVMSDHCNVINVMIIVMCSNLL